MRRTLIILTLLLTSMCTNARTFTPDYGYQVEEVKVNGLNVAYIDEGDGPETILFIHGLGGYLKHWVPVVDTLKQHYRCIAVDLPGYGHSQNGVIRSDNILNLFGETLFALLDTLELDKVTLAGHSMGGQTAVLMALERPERVDRLILASPAGLETFTPQEAAALKPYSTPEFLKSQNEQAIRQSFALNFHEDMPTGTEELIQDRLALKGSPLMDDYVRVVSAGVDGMLEAPVSDRLHELDMPVLVAFGSEDKLIPNRYLHPALTTRMVAEQGAEKMPDAFQVMVPEAGHMMPFEQPETLAKHIINFISDKPIH